MYRKRVTVFGNFGGQNLGDELILSTVLHTLRSTVKKSDITVISVDPAFTSSRNDVEAISLRERIRMVKILLTTRLFILGGGGLLKPQTISYFSLWLILFKLFGSKTMMLSLGTEFQNLFGWLDKILLILATHFTDVISVRNSETIMFLKSLGIKNRIHLTNDLTFLLYKSINDPFQDAEAKEQSESPYIILCLREFRYNGKVWRDVQQKLDLLTFKKTIRSFCEHLIKDKGIHIYFFVTQIGFETDSHITQEIVNEINDRSKVHIVKSTISLEEIVRLFKNSHCVVSMRLHPLIIAMMVGTPILGIAYSDKIESFLNQNGFEYFAADPKDLENSDLLQGRIDSILDNASINKQMIRKKAEECYIQSLENLQLLRAILS